MDATEEKMDRKEKRLPFPISDVVTRGEIITLDLMLIFLFRSSRQQAVIASVHREEEHQEDLYR